MAEITERRRTSMGWYRGLIMESFGNKMAVNGISAPIFRG